MSFLFCGFCIFSVELVPNAVWENTEINLCFSSVDLSTKSIKRDLFHTSRLLHLSPRILVSNIWLQLRVYKVKSCITLQHKQITVISNNSMTRSTRSHISYFCPLLRFEIKTFSRTQFFMLRSTNNK